MTSTSRDAASPDLFAKNRSGDVHIPLLCKATPEAHTSFICRLSSYISAAPYTSIVKVVTGLIGKILDISSVFPHLFHSFLSFKSSSWLNCATGLLSSLITSPFTAHTSSPCHKVWLCDRFQCLVSPSHRLFQSSIP